MIRLLRYLLSIVMVVAVIITTKASHIPGGDITYTCLGGNQYQVTLTLHVRCPSTLSTISVPITITNDCGYTNPLSVSLPYISGPVEVSQLCPADMANSACNGGPLPGVYQYQYSAVITLSPPCDAWHIAYSLCCRNATVNSPTSTSYSFYVETDLNTATDPCNNSPAFPISGMIPYFCVNQLTTYNWGVTEADGDSLVYSFTCPMNNATTPITFGAPYSCTNPINGITIDPNTGQVTFTATTTGSYIIAIAVDEYDPVTGAYLGQVVHDVQFEIINCTNVVPQAPVGGLTNITGSATAVQTGNTSVSMCEGDNVCFDLVFTDTDAGDILTVTSNVATVLTGATFNVVGTNPATATICWTAPVGSTGFYSFGVDVMDDACPTPGTGNSSVDITVNNCSPACFMDSINVLLNPCNQTTNLFDITGYVTFINPPATGQLIVQDCNGIQQTFNPPFSSPTNFTLPGITADGAPCNTTAWFTTDPACTISVNYNNQPNCLCQDDAGTVNASIIGSGTNNYILCDGDIIDITSNLDTTLHGGANAGITYAIYSCPPTTGYIDPATDPCFVGYVTGTGPDMQDQNVGGSAGGLLAWLITNQTNPGNPVTNNTLWFAPMTLINFGTLTYDLNCVNIGPPTQVTYLEPITFTSTEDCQNGQVSVTVNGGYPQLFAGNYNISNVVPAYATASPTVVGSGGTVVISGLLDGDMYSFDVVDDNGCPITFSGGPFTGPPDLTNTSSTNANCGNCDGSATVSPTGGQPPYSYQWDAAAGNQTSATAINLCSGTYNVTVSNASGCYATTSVIVGSTAGITATILSSNNVSCNAACDGDATANGVGGTTPYTFQWDAAAGNQVTQTASNLCAGVFNVTVTDQNICTASTTVTITEPTVLTSSISASNNASCNAACDGDATVSASGGTGTINVLWDAAAGSQTTNTATGLCAGTYSVTATDQNLCTSVSSVTITEPTAITFTSSTVDATCGNSNGSLTITANGGTGTLLYSNDNGITFQSSGTFSNLAAGTYNIVVQDANNCTATGTVSVNNFGAPVINNVAFTDPLCNASCDGSITITASGGTGTLQYSVDNGITYQAGNVFTGLCAGNYPIVVQDANNCSASSSATLTDPVVMAYTTLNTNLLCYQDNSGSIVLSASGGDGNYQFSIDGGLTYQSSGTFSNLAAGTYNIVVQDGNNCQATGTEIITEPTQLMIPSTQFGAFDETCAGACDGYAVVIPTGGTGSYTYLWTPTPANGQGTPNPTGLCTGNFTLTVTDANGCTADTAFAINGPTSVTTTVTGTPNTCNGSCDGTTDLTPNGGTTPYSYQWNDPNNSTIEDLTGLCAGAYAVTVTDNNGCQSIANITITEPTPVVVTASPNTTICQQGTANISASASGGNTGGYTYIWDQGLPNGSNQTVNPSVNTCYTVYAVDPLGCQSPSVQTCVDVNPPLQVFASPDVNICDGDATTLTAAGSGGNGGPYTYTWTNGGGSGSNIQVIPSNYPASQTYVVSLDDGCSPTVTDTVVVNFYQTPVVSFIADQTFGCDPLTVTFTENSNPSSSTCSWDFGNGFAQSDVCGPVVQTFPTGSYDVSLSVVSVDGCSNNDSIQNYIVVNPNPMADFNIYPQPTTTMNTTITFTDQSIGNINIWGWTFYDNTGTNQILGNSSEQNPEFTFPADTGTFPVNLNVITDAGCVDDTTLFVDIKGIFDFWVPNAFTPDGDGINDYFFPKGVGIDENEFTFYIFDRWGEVIFESHRLDDWWDGTARAKGGTKLVENGVYVWKIDVGDINKESHSYIGHVTVIK